MPTRPGDGLTREKQKSLRLHAAVLERLIADPDNTLSTARQNIERWRGQHRPDGRAAAYLAEWERLIAQGVDAVAQVLTGRDEHSCELRQNTPFAGVLPEAERREVLRAFREQWDAAHGGADQRRWQNP